MSSPPIARCGNPEAKSLERSQKRAQESTTQATMVDQSAVAVSSTDPSNAPSSAPVSPNDVVDVTVHPLVLLSAADHYHRVARGTRKRAVGVLLGTVSRGRVDATNSFAVPFEEDSKNPVSFYCAVCWQIVGPNLAFLA